MAVRDWFEGYNGGTWLWLLHDVTLLDKIHDLYVACPSTHQPRESIRDNIVKVRFLSLLLAVHGC